MLINDPWNIYNRVYKLHIDAYSRQKHYLWMTHLVFIDAQLTLTSVYLLWSLTQPLTLLKNNSWGFFFTRTNLWIKWMWLCLRPDSNVSTASQTFDGGLPEFLCCFRPHYLFFFPQYSQSPPSSTSWCVTWPPAQKLSANMHAGGLSESQFFFFFTRCSLCSQFQARRRLAARGSRLSDRFQARRGNLPFCLWGFFSGPFLPFSIVLGAASPGEASSNGEDYIAAVAEPSARPGQGSGLRAQGCLPVAPPGVDRAVFSLYFLKKGLLCATFWPRLLHLAPVQPAPTARVATKKETLFSTCFGDFPLLQIRNANYVLSRQREAGQ